MESELWPNLLTETTHRGVPTILVNARMSARSFGRWRLTPRFARTPLGRLAPRLAQTAEQAARFLDPRAPRAHPLAHLTSTPPPPPVAPPPPPPLPPAPHPPPPPPP